MQKETGSKEIDEQMNKSKDVLNESYGACLRSVQAFGKLWSAPLIW